MNNSPLALHGGPKTIDYAISPYNPIAQPEIDAVNAVLKKGVLSGYVAAAGDKFLGGEQVQAFEAAIRSFYQVKHAIAVNSLTSGLICAVGAIGVEPGDEIIVSPWTMCASATAILVWNAIPIFADIDKTSFNISPDAIAACITPKTKAIIVPSIFGRPAELKAICALAHQHGLKVIEDAAQTPATRYQGKYVGTWGDIGGFSFNQHKHIHCGEGGVCVTDNDELAAKMRLIRNHAEAVVDADPQQLPNMIGFNFRLGEMEAAIATSQLTALAARVQLRTEQGRALNEGLHSLAGLVVPEMPNDGHAFYMYGLRLVDHARHQRSEIAQALRAEGVPGVCERYVTVHQYPMYQHKLAYGSQGYPWTSPQARADIHYQGICPNAEALNDSEYLGLSLCEYDLSMQDIQRIILAFHKVWRALALDNSHDKIARSQTGTPSCH